jgi:hypothetical protein
VSLDVAADAPLPVTRNDQAFVNDVQFTLEGERLLPSIVGLFTIASAVAFALASGHAGATEDPSILRRPPGVGTPAAPARSTSRQPPSSSGCASA